MRSEHRMEDGEPAGRTDPSRSAHEPEIQFGKGLVPAEVDGRATEVELFTMTLGEETIYLVPFKTWSQLDVYKWRAQGKLPDTPPGLDIALDHVKVGGETVEASDPEACAKLQRAFDEWLASERKALEQARHKHQEQAMQASAAAPQEEVLRFHLELDKTGQPHIQCFEGKEMVANVACTVPGITSLFKEGLLRKPQAWKVGVLRDWVELDGEVFRLKDSAGLAGLERALNERYHPALGGGSTHEVKVFPNPASTSGFDIQFPATENGLADNRRRHLDPEAMELLSDPHRCRVLRKTVVIKFTPPVFHFKEKTADGGEHDLAAGPENMVWVDGEQGRKRGINLSKPVSHLGLSAGDLTAMFNHPSICRRVQRSKEENWVDDLHQAA